MIWPAIKIRANGLPTNDLPVGNRRQNTEGCDAYFHPPNIPPPPSSMQPRNEKKSKKTRKERVWESNCLIEFGLRDYGKMPRTLYAAPMCSRAVA